LSRLTLGVVEPLLDGDFGDVLTRGATWSILLNFLGVGISFTVHILLARSLQAEQYGLYVYALAWMNVAMLVALLEVNTAATRFVGEYYGSKKWSLLKGFLTWGHITVLGASLTVALLAAGVIWLFRDLIGTPVSSYLAACLLLPLTVLMLLKSSILQGYKRIPQSQAPKLVVRPAVFGAGVAIAVYVFGVSMGAADAILLNAFATLVALTLSWFSQRKATPPELHESKTVYRSRLWLTTSLSLVWIAASQLILSQQIDVLVVGTYLSKAEAGVYGVASQLSMLLGIASLAIVFVACPYVSQLHAQNRKDELDGLVRWNVAVGTIIGVTGLLFMTVFGRLALGWFGPDFVAGYGTLLILSVGQAAGASIGTMAGFLLTMTGHHNRAGVVTVCSAVLNLVLTIVLTPLYGSIGAAMATVVATLIKTVAFAYAAKRFVGINVFAFFSKPPQVR
jgi:O-antigen/teichoic acid export membrane protein